MLGLSQVALTLTFLAYQAWLMADAIVRTLVPAVVTRKNLLEWVTAAQAKYAVDLRLYGIYQRMAGGVAAGGRRRLAWLSGGTKRCSSRMPFARSWVAAPAVARWISLPPNRAIDAACRVATSRCCG